MRIVLILIAGGTEGDFEDEVKASQGREYTEKYSL